MIIIRQRTKDDEEIEKIEKYTQKNVKIMNNSLWVCVCVGFCVDYICALLCVVILACVCMKIHALRGKFEVVFWIYELWCVAKVMTVWSSNKILLYLWRFRNYQRTPNRMLTRRLPDTKCINASPRIRLHASIRLKSEKRKIIKCKVANEKRSRQN